MQSFQQEFAEVFNEVYPSLWRSLECHVGRSIAAQGLAQDSVLRLFRTRLDIVPRRFLTVLKVRAGFHTRRLYGHSDRNLPLYEEDEQRQSFLIGFDERILVLSFGRTDEDEQLRIEITPALRDQSSRLPSGKPRPLQIAILRESPGGAIRVEAFKRPHPSSQTDDIRVDWIPV